MPVRKTSESSCPSREGREGKEGEAEAQRAQKEAPGAPAAAASRAAMHGSRMTGGTYWKSCHLFRHAGFVFSIRDHPNKKLSSLQAGTPKGLGLLSKRPSCCRPAELATRRPYSPPLPLLFLMTNKILKSCHRSKVKLNCCYPWRRGNARLRGQGPKRLAVPCQPVKWAPWPTPTYTGTTQKQSSPTYPKSTSTWTWGS